MRISEIFGTAVSYVPVVRCVIGIVTTVFRVLQSSTTEIETQVKEVEAIHRWLKDNDVNTFTEYYDRNFKEK